MSVRPEQAVHGHDRRRHSRLSGLLLVLLALAFALIPALPAAAQEIVCYSVADEGGGDGSGLDGSAEDLLTRIDPDDPDPASNEVVIGDGTGTFNVEAAAFQPGTGVLFAVDGGRLGTVDLETGDFTQRPSAIGDGDGPLGPVGFDDVDGLTFDPSTGVLYGSKRVRTTDPDVLLVIDPESGERVAGAFGDDDYLPLTPLPDETKIDDLAIDEDGTMFAITNQGGHGDRLVTIDRTSGALTDVGATGEDDMEGLTIAPDGRLLGVTGKEGSLGGALWQIDPETGAASQPHVLDETTDYESIACLAQAPPPPPPPEVGSITVVKDASGDGSGAVFAFAGSLGPFSLDDDGATARPSSRTFDGLAAGTYSVRESVLEGWKLASVVCAEDDAGSTVDVASATATVDLDAGEDVVCTFKNTRLEVLGGPVLPPTGVSGLGALSIVGCAMIATGYAMRRTSERPPPSLRRVGYASMVLGPPPSPVAPAGRSGSSVRRTVRLRTHRRTNGERGPPRPRSP